MPITVIGLDKLVADLNGAQRVIAHVSGMTATIGSALPYAGFVTGGTRPHEIYPVHAQALWWPGAAHPVMHVNHPGTKANPFLADALAAETPALESALRQGVVAALATGDAAQVDAGFRRGVEAVHAEAVRRAPRRSGALAGSITVTYSK